LAGLQACSDVRAAAAENALLSEANKLTGSRMVELEMEVQVGFLLLSLLPKHTAPQAHAERAAG